jgi:hypothetical protein
MLKRARRPVALLCLVLLSLELTGCRVSRVSRQEPDEIQPPDPATPITERIVGATLRDGHEVRFDAKPRVEVLSDTVHAWVKGKPVAIALEDVQRVWIARTDVARSALASVGVLAGIFAVVLAAALATKESCPFVYSWDGEQFVFDAEPYGGAVTRGLERDDYGRLEHLRADSAGLYRIMVTNEVNETQYTNSMRLFVVDHAPGSRVEVDEWGRVYDVGAVMPPRVARDQDARDLLPWLRASDAAIWEPLPPADPAGRIRQEIVLTFPRPDNAGSARLVANVATGLWGSHMIREMLGLRGARVRDWYGVIDSSATALEALRQWNVREELYILKVEVETPNGWQLRGLLPGGGPFIAEERVVPLDLSGVEGDSLRLRIQPPFGFWALNSFGVSYSDGGGFSVDTIAPLSAVTADRRDMTAALQAADAHYYAMPATGDYGYVTFAAPPTRTGTIRTVFLHTRGYYQLHLAERNPPDVAALTRITNVPDGAARLSAELFAKQRIARTTP